VVRGNKKCQCRFSDGLRDRWLDYRVFCNPPFSEKNKWIEKAAYEVEEGDCPLCVMILPNCIDTKIFNEKIHGRYYWEHLPFRISFLDENNKPINGNPSGSIIVYFWKNIVRE
jgi:hypothetical protein